MPFINTKIGNALVDFEFNVDADARIFGWTRNQVRGIVGDQPVSQDSSVAMLWETGLAQEHDFYMKTCTVDNSKCYKAKTVPVIFDISQKSGYLTGGQSIKIKGFGFNHKSIDAKIDGVACAVTKYSETEFDCTVGNKAAVTALDKPFVGQHGLKRKMWNFTLSVNPTTGKWEGDWDQIYSDRWADETKNPPLYEKLHTNMETFRNYQPATTREDFTSQQLKGWFVPQVTGKHRFYMACDDWCRLKFVKTADSIKDPETLLNVNSNAAERDYYKEVEDGRKRITDWIDLVKGQNYYIETDTQNYNWESSYTLSVEIQ
jgi:hypothetical protein